MLFSESTAYICVLELIYRHKNKGRHTKMTRFERDKKEVLNGNGTVVLKERKAELEKKLKKLYNLYSEDDSDILLSTIADVKKELQSAKKQLEEEKISKTAEKRLTAARKKLDTLEETWELMTLREQKNIIRSLIEKIVISPQNVSIHYRFDFDR